MAKTSGTTPKAKGPLPHPEPVTLPDCPCEAAALAPGPVGEERHHVKVTPAESQATKAADPESVVSAAGDPLSSALPRVVHDGVGLVSEGGPRTEQTVDQLRIFRRFPWRPRPQALIEASDPHEPVTLCDKISTRADVPGNGASGEFPAVRALPQRDGERARQILAQREYPAAERSDRLC
jgi:hypothetical protein